MLSGQWLTAAQVAELLEVRIETVRRWIRRGDLPVLEIGGPRTVYRIRQADLVAFASERFPERKLVLPAAQSAAPEAPDLATEEQDSVLAAARRVIQSSQPGPPRDLVNALPAVTFRERHQNPGATSFMSSDIEAILGYGPQDFVDRPGAWMDFIHPEDRAVVLAEMVRTDETGEPFRMEYRMYHRDGHTVWIRVEAELVPGREDEGHVWEGVIIDVTERMQLEVDLQRRERQQQSIAELGYIALEADSIGSVLSHAVQHVRMSLDVTHVVAYEVLPGGGLPTVRAYAGHLDGAIDDGGPFAAPDPLTVQALSDRDTVISIDLGDDDRFDAPRLVEILGLRSGMACIIPDTVRPFGVLTAFSEETQEFSFEDQHYVRAIVHIVSTVVSRLGGQWLTVADVAGFLQVTEETVRRWIRSGDLPALHLGGARAGYRVYPSDLERFIQHRLIRADRS